MTIAKLTLEDFLVLARTHRVIPLIEEVFSGSESPVSVFDKLAKNTPGSFLLESAEQGVWSRYSFVGVDVRGSLVQDQSGDVAWHSAEGVSALPKEHSTALASNGLDALEQLQAAWQTKLEGIDVPLISGLVGHISWDVISDLESVEVKVDTENPIPRISFSMFKNLVVVDHQAASLLFVSNVFIDGQTDTELSELFEAAQAQIENMQSLVLQPTQPYLAQADFNLEPALVSNQTELEFLNNVAKAKEHVVRGDVFQVVLSQSFQTEVTVEPLDVYRVLRALNPSPYMYLINGSDSSGQYTIVGSSPEALVTVSSDSVITHPIAGSRPRGKDWDTDHELEQELVEDKKERAEHLMLVDLARNDLLKVCRPGSVEVSEFMQVHRFSHIMHLVSTVEGRLLEGKSPVDVFRATFPAGTLSGAPKPRALQIIEALEPTARGLYGGVCGYFDFAGNADLAIAIRTALIRGSVATVQAGAGIVLDSDAKAEFEETRSKARAILRSISAANSAKRMH